MGRKVECMSTFFLDLSQMTSSESDSLVLISCLLLQRLVVDWPGLEVDWPGLEVVIWPETKLWGLVRRAKVWLAQGNRGTGYLG